MVETLICFDVDGTLEVSTGPVPLERLRQLKRQGAIIYIVGNYGKLAQTTTEFEDGNIAGTKAESLRLLAERHPDALRRIYVADTGGDKIAAESVGYLFIFAGDFR